MTRPDLAIVFGTYNRKALLQKAVASVRRSVGQIAYEIVVVDGGSLDGSREWLAAQPDVVLIGQRGPLTGAVAAFNLGFAYAVDRGVPFIAHLNDDVEIVTPNAFVEALVRLRSDPGIGAVAFAFDLYGDWGFDTVNGKPYSNYGVIRLEAGMAAARAQGDPTGRAWWNPIYRTYGADSELGVWLWKLGWRVEMAADLRVHDHEAQDALRESNDARNPDRRDSKVFWDRWRDETWTGQAPGPRAWTGDLVGARVAVTGGRGFLGRRLGAELFAQGARVEVPDVDLCDPALTRAWLDRVKPDLLIHAAARVGGIGANQAAPAKMFRDNMRMGLNVLDAAAHQGVAKVVLIGTTCSYPGEATPPFKPEALFAGLPEPTNRAYGIAKRSLGIAAAAYQLEHGLNTTMIVPANLYGPGDNFEPASSHVIPAMIRKIVTAKRQGADAVTLWGDGTPSREFLYVDDAARGIVHVAKWGVGERDNWWGGISVVNLGADGVEVTMQALATQIVGLVGYAGKIVWDPSRPNGQRRRALDSSRVRTSGYRPLVALPEGLRKTIAYFEETFR